LQKFDLPDISLIKLLQNQRGCNFYAPQTVGHKNCTLVGFVIGPNSVHAEASLFVLR